MKDAIVRGASNYHECLVQRRKGAIVMNRVCCLVLVGMWLVVASWAFAAGDWPQWRFDANRSGATDEAGPGEPTLLWRLTLDYPDPAFDHQYRMCADVTYALSNDTLFGLDCDVPKMGGGGKDASLSGMLFALDPQTG